MDPSGWTGWLGDSVVLSVGHFVGLEGRGRRRFATFFDFGSH